MPHTRRELLSWAQDTWEKITGKHQEKLTIVSGFPAAEIYDYKIDEMELVYFQFLLFRYWFRNKNDEGVFEFEPINIHGPEIHPLFIDAIKYDTSPRDSCSFNALESTASDDNLLFRLQGKEKYISSPCLKKYEIKKLILGLNRLLGPSLTKIKTEKQQ